MKYQKNQGLVISKVLLPQSNIMEAFVHSQSNLCSDASLGLSTYKNHSVTQFTVVFSMIIANLLRLLHKTCSDSYPKCPAVNIQQ